MKLVDPIEKLIRSIFSWMQILKASKNQEYDVSSFLVKTLKMKSSASGAIPGHSLLEFVMIY